MKLLDIIFPKRCVGCGKVGKYFCSRCISSIKLIASNESICPVCEKQAIDGRTHPKCQSRYALDGLTSFFHYDGAIRKAIKAVKYRFIFDLAKELIDLIPSDMLMLSFRPPSRNQSAVVLGSRVKPGMTDPAIILVPIPLHSSRYRNRGFNQAEVLGKLLTQRLHVSMRTDIIKRVKKTIPQVEMKHRSERLKNMENVFALHDTCHMTHGTFFLFDDVFTTGATMRAAAKVLKQAGATFVWAITMAR